MRSIITFVCLTILVLGKIEVAGEKERVLSISVNGFELVPDKSTDVSFIDYQYNYEEGEILVLTCLKTRKELKGSLRYCFDLFGHLKVVNLMEGIIIVLKTSDVNIHNKSFTCYICNTDIQKPNHRIIFSSKEQQTVAATESSSPNRKGQLLMLACSVGVVTIIISFTIMVTKLIKMRNKKNDEIPHDNQTSSTEDRSPVTSLTELRSNEFYSGANADKLPQGCIIPDNDDSKYHTYEEIDYLNCNPEGYDSIIKDKQYLTMF